MTADLDLLCLADRILIAVVLAETAVMALACLGLIVYGLWPERPERPVVALQVPLEVLAGWAEADTTTRTDLKEAA